MSPPFIFQQWELLVLDRLGWELSAVTPYSILDHLLRTVDLASANNNADPATIRTHAETFQALAATEYVFCGQSPAVVALGCLGAALRGLRFDALGETMLALVEATGVSSESVVACMEQIEVSITLSMSGASFKPEQQKSASSSIPPPPASSTAPKVIPQPGNSAYHHQHQSTTPTDVVDIASMEMGSLIAA